MTSFDDAFRGLWGDPSPRIRGLVGAALHRTLHPDTPQRDDALQGTQS
jgi:hypothetical protein